MKEYIEKDAILKLMNDLRNYKSLDFVDAIEIVEKQPAADVVEVVRCKDCRYFYGYPMKCCMNHGGVVLTDENGFCHHAKRREDEGGDA